MFRIYALILTAVLLSSCGSMELASYDPSRDPIVKGFDIGEYGPYEVRRIQCLYANEGYEGPAAVYLTYTWTVVGSGSHECLETYSGLPIKSADIFMLGMTDVLPESVVFNSVMLYGDGESSALNKQSFAQELNSLPPECPTQNSGLPLIDCTVKISIKKP